MQLMDIVRWGTVQSSTVTSGALPSKFLKQPSLHGQSYFRALFYVICIFCLHSLKMVASSQTRASKARFYALVNTLSLVMYYGWGGGGVRNDRHGSALPPSFIIVIGFWSRQPDGGFSSLCEALNVKKFIIAK